MKCVVSCSIKDIQLSGAVLGLGLALLMGACASSAPVHHTQRAHVHPLTHPVSLENTGLVKSRLYAQLREWRGVRYRDGGLSKRGVDCSGFVHLTFRQRLGLKVPRSTELLQKAGHVISRKQLRAGDLVFFRTGFSKHHVGIYVENGKFIHASTSRGVMMSDMHNVYWSRHYWKSERLSI